MVKAIFQMWHILMPMLTALAAVTCSWANRVSAKLHEICVRLFNGNEGLRYACMFILFFGFSAFVMAQGDANAGVNAFEQVTQDIYKYIPKVRTLIYGIAAVVCLVGGFNCYHKFNNDEQDAKKALMMYVGAAILLIAAATAMPLFFVDSGVANGN